MRVQIRMVRQGLLNEMQDELQEIGFVLGIGALPGIHHPVGRPGSQDAGPKALEISKEMSPREAVPTRWSLIHRAMVKLHDLFIQGRVKDRLEDSEAVVVDGQPG